MASYSAVPSRLMFVPKGRTKLTMAGLHPCLIPHSILTGIVAALDDVPSAMAKAGNQDLCKVLSVSTQEEDVVFSSENSKYKAVKLSNILLNEVRNFSIWNHIEVSF